MLAGQFLKLKLSHEHALDWCETYTQFCNEFTLEIWGFVIDTVRARPEDGSPPMKKRGVWSPLCTPMIYIDLTQDNDKEISIDLPKDVDKLIYVN